MTEVPESLLACYQRAIPDSVLERMRMGTSKPTQADVQQRVDDEYRKSIPLTYGVRVEVLCPGLARLRDLCPDMPPNHHATITKVEGDDVWVEFDTEGQTSFYPRRLIRPLV